MADKIPKERRSWNMSRIRSANTKPEITMRSLLHRAGLRFTVNGPSNKKLPGKPDIVLPRFKTVVFVNGCFWHGHENCKISRIPKTRTEWWQTKIGRNRERDAKANQALSELGWQVVTVWECEIKEKRDVVSKVITQLNS
jgi:DNA mismatch endonuclease, patch repair protein